jgi:hypothetical protein
VLVAFALAACNGRTPLDDVRAGDGGHCGRGPAADPTFTVEGLFGGPGTFVAGTARVDASTATRLSLTWLADPETGTSERSIALAGPHAPKVAVGRLVWLGFLVDPGDTFGLSPSPWALSARDGDGGSRLFGASEEYGTGQFSPFPLGAFHTLCTFDGCPRTYEQSLTVPGATPETIANGGTATVALDGHRYHLAVRAVTQAYEGCDAATYPILRLPLALSWVEDGLYQ